MEYTLNRQAQGPQAETQVRTSRSSDAPQSRPSPRQLNQNLSSPHSGAPKPRNTRTAAQQDRRIVNGVSNMPSPNASLGLQRPWTTWPELTVRLSMLPLDISILNLWEEFHEEGEIEYMEILNPRRGHRAAIIRFANLLPSNDFWSQSSTLLTIPGNQNTSRTIKIRADLEPMNKDRLLRSREVSSRLPLRQIDFGFLSQETTMDVMRTVDNSENIRCVFQLLVDAHYKELFIRFPCVIPEMQGSDISPKARTRLGFFKATVSFSHIKNIIYDSIDEDNFALVLPLKDPPPFFERKDNAMEAIVEDHRWEARHSWERTGEITYQSMKSTKERTGVRRSNQYLDIGKWTVYRFIIPRSKQTDEAWEKMSRILRHYNIRIIDTKDRPFTIKEGSPSKFWSMVDHDLGDANASANFHLALLHNNASVSLTYEVRYVLEAAIANGIFSEQSITLEFLKTLENYQGVRKGPVSHAECFLEYVLERGERIYDPMSIFSDRSAATHRVSRNVPDHCTYVRKVTVTPSTISIGLPTVETTNRVLRQYANNADRFIRLQFTDEKSMSKIFSEPKTTINDRLYGRVWRTLRNGVQIGDRHFEFLAFGSSQLREHGAYFFCPTDNQSCEDIRSWMGDVSHIKVPAKVAARLGQCFSTTRALKAFSIGQTIKEIPDIEIEGSCFSDGVGRISQGLATEIAGRLGLFQGGFPPSAYQFRMGGYKGILVVWPAATFNSIHVRPSQKKFDTSAKNLEIIKASRFTCATTNRQTISILSCLGVPTEHFIELADRQIEDYEKAMSDQKTAVQLLSRFTDPNGVTSKIAQMISNGFMDVEEPFMTSVLHLWRAWSMKQLREKARIVVEQGAFLLGCVDETHTLRGYRAEHDQDSHKVVSNLPQIFLQIPIDDAKGKYRRITGVCVVGRNPSLHPGDLRVMEAVDVPALHHLRDVVVFPADGDRDIPSMCSGGDLDGDEFFIFWDKKMIPDEWNYPPMRADSVAGEELASVNIGHIARFFVQYMKNDSLSQIAIAHLKQADWDSEGPKCKKALELAQLHSNAVDYVKSGQPAQMSAALHPKKHPHFMNQKRANTYHSRTALGQLYDRVTVADFAPDYKKPFDSRVLKRYNLPPSILADARRLKSQYDSAMRGILKQKEINTEFEVWSTFALTKPRVGSDYKVQEDLGILVATLQERFRGECEKAAGYTSNSDRDTRDRFVAAMYRVTWEEVQIALEECKQTVWVEGRIIPKRKPVPAQMPLISFPWLFEGELGYIAYSSSNVEPELAELPDIIGSLSYVGGEEDGDGHTEKVLGHVCSDGRVVHRGVALFMPVIDTVEDGDEDEEGEGVNGEASGQHSPPPTAKLHGEEVGALGSSSERGPKAERIKDEKDEEVVEGTKSPGAKEVTTTTEEWNISDEEEDEDEEEDTGLDVLAKLGI